MEKEEFKRVIQKLVLPLFTGSYIDGEEISSPRDNEVAYGNKNSLLIKPCKAAEYRLIFNRGQPFKTFELNLIKSIIAELNSISELNIKNEIYNQTLQIHAIEKAICSSLSDSEDTAKTLIGIVGGIDKWASRTYEGHKVELGIIISQMVDAKDSMHYTNIIDKDFFALLSDGKQSYVEFNNGGYLSGYVQLSQVKSAPTICPYEYEQVARYCNEKRIGLVLTKTGDILVFKNRQLLFAKRRGVWNVFCHEEVIQLLGGHGNNSLKDIRRSIYYTALDSSFAYAGGCLVLLNKDMAKNALAHINANDILDERSYEIKKALELENAEKLYNLQSLASVEALYSQPYQSFLQEQHCYKTQTVRKLINGKQFHMLSRKLRQELVSMDGATVVDFDGNIIAVGAILKIESGSQGGGRLAAATTLAKYGMSIKISQDGTLQGFYNEKKTNKLKSLFNVG